MKRILNFFKKKDEGPFKANRILDTSEVKVDQIFTKEDENLLLSFIASLRM